MIINVSDLSSYLYCKRKFYLEKVLGIKDIPKEAIVKGSLRHEWHDKINKIEESIVISVSDNFTFDKLESMYKRNYSTILRELIIKHKSKLKQVNISLIDMFRQSWPNLLYESSSRARNIHNFITEKNIFGKELWDLLTPKTHTEYRIDSLTLGLRGIIDRLEIYDNKYVPYEVKTGKMSGEGLWPSHKIQIAAYMILLAEKFNIDIKSGYVRYADHNEDRELIMNPFLKEEVVDTKNKVFSLLESKEIPDFCDNKNKCTSCSIKKHCEKPNFP
jgi:CRISPR-associated protein Cas4